jgi:hypothetical protein
MSKGGPCAVPLGKAPRFDMRWDESEQAAWALSVTGKMESIIRQRAGSGAGCPVHANRRSDLDETRARYETRSRRRPLKKGS